MYTRLGIAWERQRAASHPAPQPKRPKSGNSTHISPTYLGTFAPRTETNSTTGIPVAHPDITRMIDRWIGLGLGGFAKKSGDAHGDAEGRFGCLGGLEDVFGGLRHVLLSTVGRERRGGRGLGSGVGGCLQSTRVMFNQECINQKRQKNIRLT